MLRNDIDNNTHTFPLALKCATIDIQPRYKNIWRDIIMDEQTKKAAELFANLTPEQKNVILAMVDNLLSQQAPRSSAAETTG